MTDSQMIRVMMQIQRLHDDIVYLMDEELPNHPNGEAICGELYDSGFVHRVDADADAVTIAGSHLSHPERWSYKDGQLRFHKGKSS